MPIHYRLDEDSGVVITEIEDQITVEEITQLFNSAVADPDVGLRRDSLVDLRKAGPLGLTITDIDFVANMSKSAGSKSTTKIAFVSEHETNVGLCTQFQDFSNGANEVQIFTDYDEAWSWLVSGRSRGRNSTVVAAYG
ncbi:MAG: hypothetical protein ACI8UO_001111 [Verrucomicrobiales bacterium]|jgi:hypothetical protein